MGGQFACEDCLMHIYICGLQSNQLAHPVKVATFLWKLEPEITLGVPILWDTGPLVCYAPIVYLAR